MSKTIQASLKSLTDKKVGTVQIVIPDQVHDTLTAKSAGIDLVKLDNNVTTIYVTSGDVDLISHTFNENVPDAHKIAFQKVFARLIEL